MELWTLWLILTVVLVAVEFMTSSLICLYAAFGAFDAMLAALMGYGWPVCIGVFAVASLVLFLFTRGTRRRLLEKLHETGSGDPTGMDALIGRTGTLDGGSELRLRLDGDSWQVRSSDSKTVLKSGDPVRVTGYDSIVLIVEKD